MVLRSGLAMVPGGLAPGLIAAAWLSLLMSPLLHDVTPGDPATYAAVGVAQAAVATLASLIPAWRATRLDPVRALRAE
jgi:ABC-type lipoprotein release transport system permease subunit